VRDDLAVNLLAGRHHRAGHLIGREDLRSARGQHRRDGGFAAAQITGKANAQHRG